MRIGITELMETGHIVLVETLSRIFCSDPRNEVIVYTTEKHAGNLSFLSRSLPNLSIVSKPMHTESADFLRQIAETSHDRLYIVTINSLFNELSEWRVSSPLFPVIHNLDEWFGISGWQKILKFFNAAWSTRNLNSLIYSFKTYFIYHSPKINILEKVLMTRGKIVVLSNAVEKQLRQFNRTIPSEIVPFSVFDISLPRRKPDPSGALRICVPGILSQYRRNYLELLYVIEKDLSNLRNKFIIDFLGSIQYENPLNQSELLLKRINNLKNKGFSIIIHETGFIPPQEYDHELSECDIILGNMNVVLNRYSQYGKTKETGLPFAMIKAGKPGILPDNYPVPEELQSGILAYKNYDDLGNILADLTNNREKLRTLQETALSNSRLFSPDAIYNKLITN